MNNITVTALLVNDLESIVSKDVFSYKTSIIEVFKKFYKKNYKVDLISIQKVSHTSCIGGVYEKSGEDYVRR